MAITKGVLSACAAALLAGAGFAQMPQSAPDRPAFSAQPQQAPVYDPNQLPSFNGRI